MIATYALTFLASWLYVTVMHEVSHVLVAWKDGATKVRIYPWPHRHEGKLYFARYSYEGIEYKGAHNLIDYAPVFMDCLTVGIAMLFSVLVFGPTHLGPVIVAGCALIDYIVWFWGFCWGGAHTDGYKYKHGHISE